MDYRYIKAFYLTAYHSSFSKAAETLSIAQSAVSRQIKLLEENVGEELIIRSSKKILLTEKGKELYAVSQRFDKIVTDIFRKEDDRPLRVGILHGLLKNWFTPILIKFYKEFDRNMKIDIQDQPQLLKGMEEGRYDIAFSTENIQSELITSLKLFDEKLVLISKDPIKRNKLENYRWIVYSDADNLHKISKKKSETIIKVDSITTIRDLVKNGVGIAIVPDHILKKSDNFNIYELDNIKKSEIFMTTLNYNKKMPSYLKEIQSFILDQ